MAKIIDITVAGRINALNDGERCYHFNGKEFKRGNSWEHCHNAFAKNNEEDYDYLALHLAFYLASWGMYRGSSFLLNMDYRIHIEPVKMMMEEMYRPLFTIGNPFEDQTTAQEYKDLMFGDKGLYKRLERYYIEAHRAFSAKKDIAEESDTLLTKILLGVFGCIPAYDRYFKRGLSMFGRQQWLRNDGNALFKGSKSLSDLLNAGQLRTELEKYHKEHPEYTFMKVVDMYFFSLGAIVEEEKVDTDVLKAQVKEIYL